MNDITMPYVSHIMKIMLVVVTFLLASCSADTNSQSEYGGTSNGEGVYQGYPCQNDCDDFKRGYDLALTQGSVDKSQCQAFSGAEKLGCESFVVDYQYENKTFEELMRHL